MGTEIEGDEENPPIPPTIHTKKDFVAAYDSLVLQAKDAESRVKRWDILKMPTLLFLRTVEPGCKFCAATAEVLQHNACESKWDAGKAMDMCRTLEELVLRLWDQPWRKDFQVIKLYSGFFRTTVTKIWTDADRLLELAGYSVDLAGTHQMTLHQGPSRHDILTAASELYLLSVECQIYREIMCLVQSEGYSMAHVAQCRSAIACNNDQAAKWIRENCRPGSASSYLLKQKHVRAEDPIYAEIDSPTPSPASSRRSLKSSFSSVNNDTSPSPSALSTSTSSIQNKVDSSDNDKDKPKDPEPIYSVVRKVPKKELNNNKSTTPTEPPRMFTSDGGRPTSAPVVNNGVAKQQVSPTRVIRMQDSGYTTKPTSQELHTIEDGSYVKIDFVPQGQAPHSHLQGQTSQGQFQGQIPQNQNQGQVPQGPPPQGQIQPGKVLGPDQAVGQYGFDLHGLRALRGAPKPDHDMFRPGTADDHKRLQSVKQFEKNGRFAPENPKPTGTSNNQSGYGPSVRQYTVSGKGEGQVNPSFSEDNQGAPVKSDRHSNLSFSTFRPPNQSPQKAKCVVADKRSSSPFDNLLEVRSPPPRPRMVAQSAGLGSVPCQLPTAPTLDLRITPETQGFIHNKKTLAETVGNRQSYYDNLPRDEADSDDVDVDHGEPDKVLQLLEYTKERLETSRSTAPRPSHTAPIPSQCYYSVPDVGKEPVSTKPSKSVTAPIIGRSEELPPPPPHIHMMGNHWQCESCTSFNLQGTEICDICGKSRLKGSEQAPLVSGGLQCPKCTLINEPTANFCEACNYSFDKGAPTYI